MCASEGGPLYVSSTDPVRPTLGVESRIEGPLHSPTCSAAKRQALASPLSANGMASAVVRVGAPGLHFPRVLPPVPDGPHALVRPLLGEGGTNNNYLNNQNKIHVRTTTTYIRTEDRSGFRLRCPEECRFTITRGIWTSWFAGF